MPIILSLVAGFAALAGLSSAVVTLQFGIGLTGLGAALGFGVLSLGTGLGAAFLAFANPPAGGA